MNGPTPHSIGALVDRLKVIGSAARDRLRNAGWLIPAAIGLLVLAAMYPVKLGVMIWWLTKMSAAIFVAYWADRLAFPYARPHEIECGDDANQALPSQSIRAGLRYVARALIYVGCLISAGLQA